MHYVGWYYLGKPFMGVGKKLFWVLVVLSSFVIAGLFCYTAITGFLTTYVLTTIDDVAAPLDKVVFPALVICNMNQVRPAMCL